MKSSELRSLERVSDSQDINCIILFPDKSYFGGARLAREETDKIRCRLSLPDILLGPQRAFGGLTPRIFLEKKAGVLSRWD